MSLDKLVQSDDPITYEASSCFKIADSTAMVD